MNPDILFLIMMIGLAVTLNLLYASNFKKGERYKQLIFPFLAVGVSFIFIWIDEWISVLFDTYLFETYQYLEPYLIILLNIGVMLTFLAIKIVVSISYKVYQFFMSKQSPNGRADRFISKTMRMITKVIVPYDALRKSEERLLDDQTVSIVYEKLRGKIYLKREWTYLHLFFIVAAALPLILSFLLIAAQFYSIPFGDFLPKYPVVSLIVLLEVIWFLGGRRKLFASDKLESEATFAEKTVTYEDLYREYFGLWKERLLAKGIINDRVEKKDHFFYEKLSSTNDVQLMINSICSSLKKQGIVIDESNTKILMHLLEGSDVLVEDPLYEDVSPYFFPALYHQLSKHKKMMVISHDRGAVKHATEWIEKGLENVSGMKQLWKVSSFTEALEQNTNPDVLVVSPDTLNEKSFLHYLNQFEKTRTLEGVILLEAEKIIPRYAIVLHAFNLNLHKLVRKKPQYVIFSDWYEGLEHTVRNIFHCEPEDIYAASKSLQKLYYMVWEKEGSNWLQQKILPKVSHRKLEAEPVLAIPAIKAGIKPVHLVNQSKTAVVESIQDMVDQRQSLQELGIDYETLDHLGSILKVHSQKLSMPVEQFTFLLVRDTNFNLVHTLHQWKSSGKTAAFVHIVCPPYLIREYLADQLSFFTNNNRTISPLAPRLSDTKWSTAYYLLERLSQHFIDEQEVLKYLNLAGFTDYSSVIKGIHELFTTSFGTHLHYLNHIESQDAFYFDLTKKEFVETSQYRIPISIKKQILPKWHRFIEIRHNGKSIGEVFEGHIYQNYLPGQLHPFNGEHYKIKEIDLERGVIDVSFEPLFEKENYRPKVEYCLSIKGQHKPSQDIKFERYNLRLKMLQVSMKMVTKGFFELDQNMDLQTMKYHSFTESNQEIIRSNDNGSCLCIKVFVRDKAEIDRKRVAYTLSLLLNELFPTLFPESYQYIVAGTELEEGFFNMKDPLSSRLKLITRTLQLQGDMDGAKENEIAVYIFEDSPLDLGMLETIRDNWEQIFDILNDYLHWLLYENKKKRSYLHFGFERFPEELQLKETFKLLDGLITRKKLREIRMGHMQIKEKVELVKKEVKVKKCFLCGRRSPADKFKRLKDGRERCFSCTTSAVDSVAEAGTLYFAVREFFMTNLGIELRQDIQLLVLSREEIQQRKGKPKPGHPRLVGKAVMDRDHKVKMMIENGAPKLQTMATLAHELTHIWQYNHLHMKSMTLEEIEGFACWVEIYMMKELGETPYAKTLKEELLSRNDEYGWGYRLICEKLKSSRIKTPFEFYAREKV